MLPSHISFSNRYLTVPKDVVVTLDRSGHTIDRNLGSSEAQFSSYVIMVESGGSLTGFMPRNLYCIFTANMVLNGAVFHYFSLPTPKTDSKLLQAKSAEKKSKRGRNMKFLPLLLGPSGET